MIKAVIFDFDGTLAETGRFLYEVCARLSEKYCPNKLSAEDFWQFKYMSIPDRFKKAGVPLVKLPRIPAEARAIYAEYKEGAEPFTGMRKLLEELKRKEYHLCIAHPVCLGKTVLLKPCDQAAAYQQRTGCLYR